MPETRQATLDTNILLDFTRLGELDTLGHHPGLDLLVPEDVLVEVEEEGQREAVDQAIQRGYLDRIQLQDHEVLETFAELANQVDDGEAACIRRRGRLHRCGGRPGLLRSHRRARSDAEPHP